MMARWRPALLACGLLLSATATAAPSTLDEALAEAQKRQAPVLVDFTAPWCYSCYYMAKNVLTGPEWARVQRDTVLLELDADSPEGAAAKARLQVKALPSFVVLNAQGRELGRIAAERTRAQFYPELAAITRRNTALEVLQQRALESNGGDAGKGVEAAREVLRSYLARHDADGGLGWFAQLPAPVQHRTAADASAARKLARLQLLKASTANDAPACLFAAEAALAGQPDCDSAYDLDRVLSCTSLSAAEPRQSFLQSQRKHFDRLMAQRVLNASPSCADVRTAVLVARDVYAALGDGTAEKAVLQKAIARIEKSVLKNPRNDRNAADNLRVFYDAAGNTEKLDALLPRLIAAWPEDYVYANRYARLLAARQAHAEALPHFASAAERAYGLNRLKNAQEWVKSLRALQRDDEAQRVVSETLKANGPWFPEEAGKLRMLGVAEQN